MRDCILDPAAPAAIDLGQFIAAIRRAHLRSTSAMSNIRHIYISDVKYMNASTSRKKPIDTSNMRLEELEQHAEEAEGLLRAMANRHRLMILCTLSQGELSVSALNERVQLSQSALSQHLAVLRADGLVETRRESQTIYYSVPEGPALGIIRVLYTTYCCGPSGNATIKKPPKKPA